MSGETAAALGIIGGVGSIFGLQESAIAQEKSLQEENKELQIQSSQAAQQRIKRVEQEMSANAVMSAAKGYSPSSTNFVTVQANNYDNYDHEQQIADQNLKWREDSINNEINNIHQSSDIQSIFSGIMTGANVYNLMNPVSSTDNNNQFNFGDKEEPNYISIGGSNGYPTPDWYRQHFNIGEF